MPSKSTPKSSLPTAAALRYMLLFLALSILGKAAAAEQQMEESGEKLLNLKQSFISLEEAAGGLPESHSAELLSELQFVPPQIDFGTWSLGQARTQLVTLFNQHTNRSVLLNSVAGPSPMFYSSFLGNREVPPQGNTTFSVVFLPRQLGAIATQLHIATSFGRTDYSVSGEGSACPYRLKPLVGIRAPMNATLAPEIHMYNPHERPLQILEIYSSGGEFQLELPSGGSEGPHILWQIPPHTLKPIVRICFHGRTAGNHSAYIRIKIAEKVEEEALQEMQENLLVIPVEFEILPEMAAYARNPLADFGRLASSKAPPLHFKLDMQNMPEDLDLQLIGSYSSDLPGLSFDASNSSIVLQPQLFEQSASINDILTIKRAQQPDLAFTVLVRAEIYVGGLSFERNATSFTKGSGSERSLIVRNDFGFPLALHNISLSNAIDAELLQLEFYKDEAQPLLLQPGESVKLLQARLLKSEAQFAATLNIATNVSNFELPLISCSGRLHVSTSPFEVKESPDYNLELDLGVVPFAESSRDGFVLLRNDNPMAIPLMVDDWLFLPPKSVYHTSFFKGCRRNDSYVRSCQELQPNETAVYQIAIQTYIAEPSFGVLRIRTPFEQIELRVKFQTAIGELHIAQEQLHFRNCFPGKLCNAVLSIRSSFEQPVRVNSIKFTHPSLRFKDFNAKGSSIAAQSLTKIGRIYFEPAAYCDQSCYIRPLSEDKIFPRLPANSNNNNLLYDAVELRQRAEFYRKLKRQLLSVSLTLHSAELPPLWLDFSIDIDWPRLGSQLKWSAIEAGQRQRQEVLITNPTNQALLLDYYLSDPSYARRTQLSLPHEVIDGTTACYLTDRQVFHLVDGAPKTPLLLPAGANLSIAIDFSSPNPAQHCTLLHLRSNLTLYEAIWLTGKAVQSQFRLANRRPNSTSPLNFELQFLNDQSCEESLTTKSFLARNAGAATLQIEGFLINQQPCEDSGFRISNCQGFQLRENETRKVEIQFSADFTASRVLRQLTLLTNLSYDINYLLLAQLPAETVERCARRLPRPHWEQSLSHAALAVLLVSFFLVIFAAIFDYRALMAQQSIYDAARFKGQLQPTFNLRNIAKLQAEEALAANLAANQQQKLRNSQAKEQAKEQARELRRRSNNANKSKGWTWSNVLSKQTQSTKQLASEPSKEPTKEPSKTQPLDLSLKSMKKSATPSPPQQAQPRVQRKLKQPLPKLKVEPEMPEKQAKINLQENVSPKLSVAAKSNAETQTQKELKVLKEQNGGSAKKLGKTPGRERRSKEQAAAAAAMAATQKPANAANPKAKVGKPRLNKQLNFYNNANPVANSPPASPDALQCITSPWETSSRVSFSDVLQTKAKLLPLEDDNLALSWQPQAAGTAAMTMSELGPIGSRKSQCALPMVSSLWEPLMLDGAANGSNNSSLYNMPTSEHKFMAMDLPPIADLGDIYDREQWERSELIIKQQLMLQQAQQQQQQQQQELLQRQSQLLLSNVEPNNWAMHHVEPPPTSTSSWYPLGYSAASWQSQTQPLATPSVIRPPPGLENAQPAEQLQLEQLHQQQQQQQRVQMPTQYDPFTSPSSIWSDNWRQHQSQSSQQRNNHIN